MRKELRLTQKAAADAVGMSERGWQELEKDTNLPRGDTLQHLAAMGYDPTWILTGIGSPRIAEKPLKILLDDWLLEELGKVVVHEHKAAKIALPPEKVATEAAFLFNELADLVQDIRDRQTVEVVIPLLGERLRNRLREATTKPGTGKRAAS